MHKKCQYFDILQINRYKINGNIGSFTILQLKRYEINENVAYLDIFN